MLLNLNLAFGCFCHLLVPHYLWFWAFSLFSNPCPYSIIHLLLPHTSLRNLRPSKREILSVLHYRFSVFFISFLIALRKSQSYSIPKNSARPKHNYTLGYICHHIFSGLIFLQSLVNPCLSFSVQCSCHFYIDFLLVHLPCPSLKEAVISFLLCPNT